MAPVEFSWMFVSMLDLGVDANAVRHRAGFIPPYLVDLENSNYGSCPEVLRTFIWLWKLLSPFLKS